MTDIRKLTAPSPGRTIACEGKTRFATFADAKAHATRASRRREGSFNPYHCRECGAFHFGARPFQKSLTARFRREREEARADEASATRAQEAA